jgi:hypothetical protein
MHAHGGAKKQQDRMSLQQKNPIFLLLFFYNKIHVRRKGYFGGYTNPGRADAAALASERLGREDRSSLPDGREK